MSDVTASDEVDFVVVVSKNIGSVDEESDNVDSDDGISVDAVSDIEVS